MNLDDEELYYTRKMKGLVKDMYKVKYSIEGIIKEITINADDAITAQNIFSNMYGNGKVQIIDIRRV